VSSLGSDENRELKARYGEAFEVYVPFTENGNVVGAYEIYTDPAPVRPIRQLVWIAVVGGFIILFLSLFAVVRNAGAFIRRQQVEREQLIRQNEERFPLAGRQHRRCDRDPRSGCRHSVRQPAG